MERHQGTQPVTDLCHYPLQASLDLPVKMEHLQTRLSGWPSPQTSFVKPAHCLKKKSEVAQSCPTLCDPMDCSSPGSSIHGIFQARVLEWSRLPFPFPDDLPDPGIEPGSPALLADALQSEPPGIPDSSAGEESSHNAGDPGLIPGSGRSAGEGTGYPLFLGFSCNSAGKESACNTGDLGLIPGLGRCPGEGKGYPLQYSGLENSMNYTVHAVTKSRTQLRDFHFHSPFQKLK